PMIAHVAGLRVMKSSSDWNVVVQPIAPLCRTGEVRAEDMALGPSAVDLTIRDVSSTRHAGEPEQPVCQLARLPPGAGRPVARGAATRCACVTSCTSRPACAGDPRSAVLWCM